MNNKNIFAENLNKQMKLNGKTRRDISEALGISYYTVSDWANGKKYPRMDKVELLANYFGIAKSDLIEVKIDWKRTIEKNDTLADIIVKLRTDSDFLSLVEDLSKLDKEKLQSVQQLLSAFLK